MRLAGSPSWCISVDPWPESFDIALWFRAAERIDVAAGGVVPGPAEVEPLPGPSTAPSDAAGLAEGWLAWWHALTAAPELAPPFGHADRIPQLAFSPPGFPGLAGFPVLQRAVTLRWGQAQDWHTARKMAGLNASLRRGDIRITTVVSELERDLGRTARPFSLDFILVPTGDDQVRLIGPDRYLVPERLYDGPRWPRLLRTLLIPYV